MHFAFPLRIRFPLAAGAVVLGGLPTVHADPYDSVVTFNEVHYHDGGESGVEWVEIHNQMAIRIDLTGWRLSGGVEFDFPDDLVLEPRAHLVVGAGEGALGPWRGRLDNRGDTIRLRDNNGRVMDELVYEDRDPWPAGPDGCGVTLSKRQEHLASWRPDSWTASLREGGTPGEPNFPEEDPGLEPGVRLSELSAEGDAGWVELINPLDTPADLAGYSVVASGAELPLDGFTLGPRELLVLEPTFSVQGAVCLFGPGGVLADSGRTGPRPVARRSGSDVWWSVRETTRGLPNTVGVPSGIVINEIMYRFPPRYADPDRGIAFAESGEEWIELFNAGDEAVSLEEWSLDGGVEFEFPPETLLEPGAFVVVARDAEILGAKYPGIAVLGDFGGRLGDREDVVILRDALGNPVDRVHYFDGGRWPAHADGGGCSLELRHPAMDNSVPESWAASRESDKAEWVEIRYSGVGREPARSNNPERFHEFLMGLLDAGEVLIDEVSVVSEGEELMENGDFDERSIFTGEALHWRIFGTHEESRVVSTNENPRLHLRATGALEHSFNIASSTLAGGHRIDRARQYEISLRAKWVAGSPQLNTRLYFNRMARTHILPIPENLGTPGRENSARETDPAPVLRELRHAPLLPAAGEAVTVSATAAFPLPAEVRLFYRADGGPWAEAIMGGDGSGRYSATVPGAGRDDVMQFYAEARGESGAATLLPAAGEDSRALVRFGNESLRGRPSGFVSIVMLSGEAAAMMRPEVAVSNARRGATVITSEGEIHYDAGVRLRGSPYGRRGNRVGYNVRFGDDRPFRGVHETIALDGSVVMPNGNSNGFAYVGAGAGTNELLVNQIARRAGGIPITYDDVTYVEAPRRGDSKLAQLRLSRYGRAFLEGSYGEGAGDGAVHKFELVYHPTSTVDGRPDGAKDVYNAVLGVDIESMGDDKDAYRFNYIPGNNRDRDDFSGIIRLAAAFSSRTDARRESRSAEAMEVEEWLRVFAFQSLIGVADTYNMGLAHNLVLYTPPDGGKVRALPWDLDHAFYYAPTMDAMGVGGTKLALVFELPNNRRRFLAHLHDIAEKSYRLDYLDPWIDHYDDVTSQNFADRFRDYIGRRREHVLREVRREIPSGVAFALTTNGGQDFETESATVTLEGRGGVEMGTLRIAATGETIGVRWTDMTTWTAEIPLGPGPNVLALEPADLAGNPLDSGETDSIAVTSTAPWFRPRPGDLEITEIHYHPQGDLADSELLEFVELTNLSEAAVNLAGIGFTRGIEAAFGSSEPVIVDPGESVVVVRDPEAFRAFYGEGARVVADYGSGGTRLSNGGEKLILESGDGQRLLEAEYGDGPAWPQAADGGGRSLVRRPGGTVAGGALAWRSSDASGGDPGVFHPTSLDALLGGADPHGDPDGNGRGAFLDLLLGGGPGPVIGGDLEAGIFLRADLLRLPDDVIVLVEQSSGLATWETAEGEWIGREETGESVTLRWAPFADGGAGSAFWRMRFARDRPSG